MPDKQTDDTHSISVYCSGRGETGTPSMAGGKAKQSSHFGT